MQLQRRRDTAPEVAIRRVLHAHGLRYRVAFKVPGLPRRTIDVAFPRKKVALFIDGCFWHGCPQHGVQPKNNADWWHAKLQGNAERDRSTDDHLQRNGWTVIRIWEHADPLDALSLIQAALEMPNALSQDGNPEELLGQVPTDQA